MQSIPAWLVTCLAAAVAVGCGTAQAPQQGSTARSATPAAAASQGQQPGAAATSPAGAATPSGCQGAAPAGPLTVTLAGNGKTYCVRVGDKVRVYLRGTDSSRWLQPLVNSNVLVPIPDPARLLARGVTGASFAAARSGQVIVTSVRPPCRVPLPAKGGLEPAFPLPRIYPLQSCASGHRFSVWIKVTA